uniref:guanylate kinase n=1 Tax=Hirondellea gigas TaxID=1518452 RepID=A0A6A7G2J6_9CRUS
MKDYPNRFGFSVSHTTRGPRPGEQNGREYHFTDLNTFQALNKDGAFLETALFCGNNYGTSYTALMEVLREGRWCILDIDTQGVKQIKEVSVLAENNYFPVYVFIKPPSLEMLQDRLRKRNTESEESLKARMEAVAQEIQYGTHPGNFDAVIVNDDLDTAYKELRAFLDPMLNTDKKETNGEN